MELEELLEKKEWILQMMNPYVYNRKRALYCATNLERAEPGNGDVTGGGGMDGWCSSQQCGWK